MERRPDESFEDYQKRRKAAQIEEKKRKKGKVLNIDGSEPKPKEPEPEKPNPFAMTPEELEKYLEQATPEEKKSYEEGKKYAEMLKVDFNVELETKYKLNLKHKLVESAAGYNLAVVYNFDYERSVEMNLLSMVLARDAAANIINYDNSIEDKKKKMDKRKLGMVKNALAFCDQMANELAIELMRIYKEQAKEG